MRDNAAVRLALEELAKKGDGRLQALVQPLLGQDVRRARQAEGSAVVERLDFEFFKRHVQPIFFEAGPDGQACADCHLNHGILALEAPGSGRSLDEVTRHNYRSVLRVVDLDRPERSLLLRKPLSDASSEGVVGGGLSHGGDVRWPERERSRQYQIILDWLNGAREQP